MCDCHIFEKLGLIFIVPLSTQQLEFTSCLKNAFRVSDYWKTVSENNPVLQLQYLWLSAMD